MSTFTQLVEAAQKKGFSTDIWTTFQDRWGDSVLPTTYVQINTEEHVWCTWRFYPDMYNISLFEGRYNQANGVTQKTWRKESRAFELLGVSRNTLSEVIVD